MTFIPRQALYRPLDPKIIAKYDGPVPRYTSYPTAPHFSDGVTAGDYAAWLGALRAGDGALSVYVHVPYCQELCTYCGCHTKITRRYAPVAAYVDALLAEIDLVARHLPGRFALSQVHFGGGTPNMLHPADFRRIMARLGAVFALGPDTETAAEVDPRLLTPEMAQAMAEAGVTRVSMGVQDLNDDVQQAIGRVQPLEVVDGAMAMLRAAGIRQVNLDLMYGLPLQTVEKVTRTADLAAALGPQRLALFGYAHVPWMKKHQRLLDALPRADGPERHAQAEAAATRLALHGYRRVGLDHFALATDPMARAQAAGRLHRNFQGYTTDGADVLIGVGASAIGALPDGYVQNAPDIGSYMREVNAGQFATRKGIVLTAADRTRRAIIERLMCDLAVDLDDFGGARSFAGELAALQPLERDGLVRVEGARLTVPEGARALVRVVAAKFDAYLDPAAGRHSRAV